MSQSPAWFKGSKETDPGEDGYDGRIWEPPHDPTAPDAEPYEVAQVYDEATADRIVRCVNMHDELVAALRRARQFIANGIQFGYIDKPKPGTSEAATLPIIEAVLYKVARGQPK